MSDPVLAALIGALASLIVATLAILRWWIDRRDAKRKAKGDRATRILSESEAIKTIRTLRRQLREVERHNDVLRGELNTVLLDRAGRAGGGRTLPEGTTR